MNPNRTAGESTKGVTGFLAPEAPKISFVQNRLTIAGLALSTLFFSASFSLSLYGSLHPGETIDYRVEFAPIETSLALGVTACLLTIVAFLVSQQLTETSGQWYLSRRLWFSLGNVWLYLALSQAMSAGLMEIVYGVALFHQALGMTLGIVATPVWLLLLIGAPVHFILRTRPVFGRAEQRALLLAYVVSLGVILVTNAEVYRLRAKDPATPSALTVNVLVQFVQPLTWPQRW